MLYVLVEMVRHDAPLTSEQIARMLKTNSAVVRRTMAGLRRAGYVSAEKGHGGGWRLATSLSTLTILDVYRAVGSPRLLAIGSDENSPMSELERAVGDAFGQILRESERSLLERFGTIPIADLASIGGERSTA